MKKSHIATLLIFLIAIPATLVLGMQLPGRWYFLTSTLIIGQLLILPFLHQTGTGRLLVAGTLGICSSNLFRYRSGNEGSKGFANI